MGGGEVFLFDASFFDLFVDHTQGFCVFSGNHDAAGVAVDAVAKGGGKALLVVGIILTFSEKIGLDM